MRTARQAGSFLLFLTLGAAACGHKPEPETPSPVADPPSNSVPVAVNERPQTAPPESDDQMSRTVAVLGEKIRFSYDQAELDAAARATLDAKAAALRADPSIHLRIAGHADERGSDEYNFALGMRRATNAQRYLIGLGVPASRLDVVSYGEERPADAGHDENAWAANRRDEFEVTQGLSSQ
jgi:peptidoglycan-associated lipoprotein